MKTLKPLHGTQLENAVIEIVNNHVYDGYPLQSFIEDLQYGGCQSGLVSELVYYSDTIKFYEDNKEDINALIEELFGDKLDYEDPLYLEDSNKNLLAWFAFEESVFVMGRQLGIDC